MDISTPLKPAVLYILLSLADRETYGYALMQAVRERSGGVVNLRTGSFYRHLSKLLDEGLVAELGRRPADTDPRRGAHYRLTPRGQKLLATERQRIADLAASLEPLRHVSRKSAV
jgi:PadR family transcriptional regulator, regulatory protein PadR